MRCIFFIIFHLFCVVDFAAGQTGSHYYSRLHYDTSSVVYNNYITGIQYDEVHHRLYTTMTSFNNYFPGDPRPRMYSQLLVLDPDNGDIVQSYTDTFPDNYIHNYLDCQIIDGSLYWSGYMYHDSAHACNKSNNVLLKTDLDLNPVWRIVFDYDYKYSQYGGAVYPLDEEGNVMYIFGLDTYADDTCFSHSGAYNVVCKIDKYGHVYADTVLTHETYRFFNRSHVLAKRDDHKYWSVGRVRQSPYMLNNFVQALDTSFHVEAPIMMDWFFIQCYLGSIQRSNSPLEEYYVSGFKWDGGSTYSKGLNMKMDASGHPLWLYIQEGENVRSEFFMSALTQDDDIIMLGYGTMRMDTDPKSHGIVYKLNRDGDLQWMREIKESDDPATAEYLNYFVLLPCGDIVATGHTSAFDSSIMRRRQYGWLVRIDGYGCQEPGCHLLSTDDGGDGYAFSVYPNPSEDGVFNVSFEGRLSGGIDIEVHDVGGRSVYRATGVSSPHVIDIRQYGRGVYFVSVRTSYGQSVRRVVYR